MEIELYSNGALGKKIYLGTSSGSEVKKQRESIAWERATVRYRYSESEAKLISHIKSLFNNWRITQSL